jgi:sec-independent protein translocase protein TatC
LRDREKRAIRPVFLLGILCFVAGAAFCYTFVAPSTFEFFVWLDLTVSTKPSYTLQKMLDLLVTFMIIFGASFEIPLVTAILSRLGLLRPEWLTKYWRGVILGCFVLGAIISPAADLFSFLMMAGTLVVLYGVSVVLSYLLYPKDKALKDKENDEYERRISQE